jgi:hypothetical protein
MTFDISRNTFNAWNDYLGVVMQQGRVHLDSDWNELLAEFTRRIHAGTLDVVGLSGVPSTTPGAFQILVTPPDTSKVTHVTIGVGRMYVDGILAENHGSAGAPQWDPLLADFSGSPATPLDYTAQPYVRGAALPAAQTGPYLVYLDVWQRDVSYLQDPSLVDQAVGIDTTGRLQTVWQVKLLDVSAFAGGFAGSTPDSTLWSGSTAIASGPVWQTLTQGSPSLLTNGPAIGYTGQENQLYRVEIHQGGTAAPGSTLPATYASGMATFKWSRENGSVATAVTAISSVTNSLGAAASQLNVVSLGRDQVLGFNVGDWIEITDDYLELNGMSATAGSASSMQPGELHQIDNINVAALTITLDSPVGAGNFPLTGGLTDPTRHTRIRRWDQRGTVYLADGQTAWATASGSANGIPVPPAGTSLILENGVTVAFDLSAQGSFQTGDYWTFAARTADGSVAPLTRAPAAGIDHHICRLAIVDFTASPPSVTDCRTVFQSLSNRSIHVTGIGPPNGVQLISGGTLSVQDLNQGIIIYFDSPIDPAILTQTVAPICFITVQLPDASGGWLNPVILVGSITVDPAIPRSITWTPAAGVQAALLSKVTPTSSVLARLTLKGDSIWAFGGPPFIYLNGAALADGRAYADFDMWFWLNSQPPVALSASSLTFGNQTVGTSSAQLRVTLTNNTAGQVTFPGTGISLSGADAADFTVTNNCGTGIAAGANCTINVIFSPTSVAPFLPTRTATINIAASDSNNNVITVPPISLTGTALAPWLLATPGSLTFPSTFVGDTSTLTVTLSNAGTSPLSISAILVTGTAPASPAAAARAAKIADAKVPEAKVSDIKVTDKITDNKVSDVKVSDVKVTDGKVTDKISDVKVTDVKVTDKVADKIPDIKVSDVINIPPGSTPAPGDFSQTSNCVPPGGGTLQPGQACTITVSFTPSAIGVRTAFLQINHNAAGSTNSIAMTGSGMPHTKFREVKVTDVKNFDGIISKVSETTFSARPAVAQTAAPAGAAETPALKSFITPPERPAMEPPATEATPSEATPASGAAEASDNTADATKGAKPKNKPKPR